jgi:hypothetical protein
VELAIDVLAAVDLPAVDLEATGLAGVGATTLDFVTADFETGDFDAGDLVVVEFLAAVDFAGTVGDWAFDDCKVVIAAKAAMRATGSGMARRRKDPV